jgi:hypothetical protein
MFDPGGVGEWSLDELGMISPPQSPRVHPRSRAEGASDDLGGRKEKRFSISTRVYLFVHTRRPQGAGCACYLE